MTAAAPAPPPNPADILRSRQFVLVLVFSAVVGLVVSVVAWGFLELVDAIQQGVFTDLPDALGFDSMPSWWPLPWLALAGVLVAFAVTRLPGNGGHIPAKGLQAGAATPEMLPGILLAALASLGLGIVLGPEAPLIALGGGLAAFLVKLVKRDAPPQLLMVVGAAGSFAAIAVIFESPIIAAVLIIEATGLGGPTLPVVLLPGLLAAGVGSVVFIGFSHAAGLNTSAYSLGALTLPTFAAPQWGDLGWSLVIALGAAVVGVAARQVGLVVLRAVSRRPFVLVPAAGLGVGLAGVAFALVTHENARAVLFSGQAALPSLVTEGTTMATGTLAMLFVGKAVAWAISLGAFRGGPTFPALFLGATAGVMMMNLPGLSETPAVAVAMGCLMVAMLKLPLSSIVVATLLTAGSGAGAAPLIVVSVVAAYLATIAIEWRLGQRAEAAPA